MKLLTAPYHHAAFQVTRSTPPCLPREIQWYSTIYPNDEDVLNAPAQDEFLDIFLTNMKVSPDIARLYKGSLVINNMNLAIDRSPDYFNEVFEFQQANEQITCFNALVKQQQQQQQQMTLHFLQGLMSVSRISRLWLFLRFEVQDPVMNNLRIWITSCLFSDNVPLSQPPQPTFVEVMKFLDKVQNKRSWKFHKPNEVRIVKEKNGYFLSSIKPL
jgi:hypothetical protein